MQRKQALVTGASRGIGRAIAAELAGKGYDLILTCLSSIEGLLEYARNLEETHSISCVVFQGDIGNPQAVEELFSSIRKLDVLVNNAGISHIGLLQDMAPEEWRQIMAVNLDGVFYTCRHAIPLMLHAGGGRILNISSVWGNVGASMEVAYSASKGAVNSFTRALAKELAPSNIQVNAIACGIIDTDMNRCFDPAERQVLIQEIPADRMGTAREAAALAGQIIAAPSYMTGQIIALDGGWI